MHRSYDTLRWLIVLMLALVLAACAQSTPDTADNQADNGAAENEAPDNEAADNETADNEGEPTEEPTATEEAAEEGEETVLRIATGNTVSTLDPIKSVAAGDITVLGQLYSRLLRVTPEGELVAGLAETWDLSEDGLTYTFTLREAQFSDGTPVTADDVVFSYNRLRDPEVSVYSGTFQVIESVEALDERTVAITMDALVGTFPAAFEMFNAGIVPQHAVESMGEEGFAQNPVVSGPYMVREWRPNDALILERNPNYWREGYPKIDVVEILEVPNDSTRVSMLRTGEADVIQGAPWVNLQEFESEEGIEVPYDPSSVINIILINHSREKFQDLRVRQAMAMAIDVPSIVEAVTFGHGTPANSLLPNTLEHYNPNLSAIQYDPDQARQLLDEAGVAGMEIEFLMTAGSSVGLQITQLIQDQLNEVGFNATIAEVDLNTWWTRVPEGDYDAAVTWWYNETADPDLAVRWALCGSCGNESFYSFYHNDRIDELTELGLREPDVAARRAIYYEIQQIALDEVAQIPLFYQPYQNAHRDYVEGLSMNPAIQWTLEEATISK